MIACRTFARNLFAHGVYIFAVGQLKARLAKLRTQLLEPGGGGGREGEGFDVTKSGDARVALIGFPSVGKSTLLSVLTGTESAAASYEFTTLTCTSLCFQTPPEGLFLAVSRFTGRTLPLFVHVPAPAGIPGNIHVRGTKIQLLDLPGIIEGAAHGKGRGRQVIAVAKSSDLVLMVLDAGKEEEKNHRAILEAELEMVGLRLNQEPPNIYFKKSAYTQRCSAAREGHPSRGAHCRPISRPLPPYCYCMATLQRKRAELNFRRWRR